MPRSLSDLVTRIGAFLVFIPLIWAPCAAHAQCQRNPVQTLTPPDPAPGVPTGYFGRALAADGATVVVGKPRTYVQGVYSGIVQVYEIVAGQLQLRQTLEPPILRGNSYGGAVAVSGDVIAVGESATAPHTGPAWDRGAVHLYRFDGASYVFEQTVLGHATVFDGFGYAVGLDGDRLVVGARDASDLGAQSHGAVHVFNHDGSSWVEEVRILPAVTSGIFGQSVDVSGDVIAIRRRRASPQDYNQIEIRRRSAPGVWDVEIGIPTGGSSYHNQAVDLDGDRVIVGATDTGSGVEDRRVRIYHYEAGTWHLEASLRGPTHSFGHSVMLDGDLAVAGDPLFDFPHGAALVFRRVGDEWLPGPKLSRRVPFQAIEDQGETVAVTDGIVISSSYGFGNDTGYDDGVLLVYGGFGPGDFADCNSNGNFDACDLDAGDTIDDNGDGIPDECACFAGNVGLGGDGVTDVLFVNGSAGGEASTVHVLEGDSISLSIDRAPGGGTGKFCMHANLGTPSVSTLTEIPRQIGEACFPILLSAGATPVSIWNGIGKEVHLGASDYFGSPIAPPDRAPTTFVDLPSGDVLNLPMGTVLTLQGVTIDPESPALKPASLTNAVVLEINL